jgi:hypothetical protein
VLGVQGLEFRDEGLPVREVEGLAPAVLVERRGEVVVLVNHVGVVTLRGGGQIAGCTAQGV